MGETKLMKKLGFNFLYQVFSFLMNYPSFSNNYGNGRFCNSSEVSIIAPTRSTCSATISLEKTSSQINSFVIINSSTWRHSSSKMAVLQLWLIWLQVSEEKGITSDFIVLILCFGLNSSKWLSTKWSLFLQHLTKRLLVIWTSQLALPQKLLSHSTKNYYC